MSHPVGTLVPMDHQGRNFIGRAAVAVCAALLVGTVTTLPAFAGDTVDADTFDFFVFERSLGDTPGRSWTFAPTLEGDFSYTFALTEVGSEVVPVVLSYPAAPAADAQIVGLHAAGGLPALDLYLEPPGVGIAGATPRGTFDVQGQIAPVTLPSGDYELTLTAAGDPANVLLTTTTITLPAGATTVIIAVPEGGQGPQPLSVLVALR